MNQPPYISNFQPLVLRPQVMQFFIDNLSLLLFTSGGFLCAGLDGMPFRRLFLCLSAVLLLALVYRFIYLKRMVYRITDEQLIHEHGVFTRNSEYVELYRVVDFGERSSLLQQLAGLKTVSVHSGDRSAPKLDLIGMDAGKELVSIIRERVEYNKRRMQIYEITNR